MSWPGKGYVLVARRGRQEGASKNGYLATSRRIEVTSQRLTNFR